MTNKHVLFVQSETVDAVRLKARELGISMGDLAGLYLRFGLAKMPPQAVADWARANPPRMGRPPAGGEGLTKNERRALDTLERLRGVTYPGPWGGCRVFDVSEIAGAAGLTGQQARIALAGLTGAGRVETASSPERDRWGRPLTLATWIAGDAVQADQARALAEIVAVRRELFALAPDPMGAELVARKIRQSTGWSDRLVGLEAMIERLQPPYRSDGPACVAWLRDRWPVAVP